MTEQELQQYLIEQYPKEDEGCEWKEFKNLKNASVDMRRMMPFHTCQHWLIWMADI